jgi:hypothetical protein
MRTLLASLLLAGLAAAQNLTAKVNDPLSHGMLGDGKLSLDEAVRLANDNTFRALFSPQEANQLSGFGLLLSTIELDATVTPVITYERDLTPIVTVAHSHQDLALVGVNGRPVLDGQGTVACLPCRTNHLQARNVDLRNGQVGLDYDSTGHYHAGVSCELFDSVVSGQSQAGIRVRAPITAIGLQVPTRLRNVLVSGVPVGLDIADSAQFGAIVLEAEHVNFAGCATAVLANVNSQSSTSTYEFFRCSATGGDYGIVVQRAASPANNGQFFLRVVHGSWSVNRTAFDVMSTPNADTVFHHHNLVVRAGAQAGDHALLTRPKDARFDLHGTENRLTGAITIQGNLNSRRLYFHNNRCDGGPFTLDWNGVPPERNVHWNTFTGMPVTIAAASRTPVTFEQCEFDNSPVNGASAFATATLLGCWRNGAIGGNVIETVPAPSPWLGRASVAPGDPQVGAFVDWTVDLRPDTAAVWMLNVSEARPLTTNDPYRFYLMGFRAAQPPALFVPGIYRNQDNLRVPIPNDGSLRGWEFYAQPVMFPTMGQGWVFPITLPAGGRFLIR